MTYIIISFNNQQLNDRQNKQQLDSFFIHHGQEITRKRILNNHIIIFIREMIVKMTKRKLNKQIEPNIQTMLSIHREIIDQKMNLFKPASY